LLSTHKAPFGYTNDVLTCSGVKRLDAQLGGSRAG